jgi:tripartite ATP-independent transporter DctP family solute receptor
MPTFKQGIVTVIVCAVLVGVATAANAGEVFRWTFADPNDPVKTATAAQALIFKTEVEKLSAGQIKVEIYPSGQLGDQRSMVQQVRRGTIGAANIAVGVLGSLYYPKLGVIDLPFLYTSRAQFRRVMENSNPFIHELIEDLAKASGIRVLGFQPYGFRQITNNKRPIEKPADMAGLKIRTMEIVPHQEMMKALGAVPVPIPYLELYTSLQTGVVEGQENPPTNIFQQKFYQVQKYMTISNHLMTVGAIIVNDKWFQALSPELRKAVTDAEREARIGHDGIGAVQDIVLVDEIEKQGVQVARLSPQQIDAFRTATIGPVRAWAEQQWGKEFVAGFYKNLSDTDRY